MPITLHQPIPLIEVLAGHLTRDQIARYVASECPWVAIETARSNQRLRQCAAIFAFGGENPMKHHARRISRPGMAGAAQVFEGMISPGRAKHSAGNWLVAARQHRANGRRGDAALCLNNAARARLRAAQLLRAEEEVAA